MLNYLHYALATICFALSVACFTMLLLSWTGLTSFGIPITKGRSVDVKLWLGEFRMRVDQPRGSRIGTQPVAERVSDGSRFVLTERGAIFPLWFPALVFALAGVGALRLDRRFTIRSAIIATTVVAGLLGMAVAL